MLKFTHFTASFIPFTILVVYVAKGFYGTTEISVAKVSRMRTANAERYSTQLNQRSYVCFAHI